MSLEFRSKQRAGEAHLGVMSSRGLAEILGGWGPGRGRVDPEQKGPGSGAWALGSSCRRVPARP